MSDWFCSWMTILLISLIADTTTNVIVHHLVDSDSKCARAFVLDNLVLARDVELEHVVEVHPWVRFLWAHLVVHTHDELLLVM